MFPKLDGDLSLVAQHFRFDHLTVSDANDATTSTTLATRVTGTQTRSIHDDDEDATLSVDCQTISDTIAKDDFIVSKATKILEEVIKKAEIPKRRSETSLIESARSASRTRSVRKQMSMHESGSTMSLGAYSHHKSDIERYPRRNVEYSRFLSIDHRSISDTEDNTATNVQLCTTRGNSKTQSCANLKLSPNPSHSPGAVLIKEKYIEPPKRFVRGRSLTPTTGDNMHVSHSVDRMSASGSTLKISTSGGALKPRFITTKVDESQLSDANQFEK